MEQATITALPTTCEAGFLPEETNVAESLDGRGRLETWERYMLCVIEKERNLDSKYRLDSFTFLSETKCTVLTKYIASEFPSPAAED